VIKKQYCWGIFNCPQHRTCHDLFKLLGRDFGQLRRKQPKRKNYCAGKQTLPLTSSSWWPSFWIYELQQV